MVATFPEPFVVGTDIVWRQISDMHDLSTNTQYWLTLIDSTQDKETIVKEVQIRDQIWLLNQEKQGFKEMSIAAKGAFYQLCLFFVNLFYPFVDRTRFGGNAFT